MASRCHRVQATYYKGQLTLHLIFNLKAFKSAYLFGFHRDRLVRKLIFTRWRLEAEKSTTKSVVPMSSKMFMYQHIILCYI